MSGTSSPNTKMERVEARSSGGCQRLFLKIFRRKFCITSEEPLKETHQRFDTFFAHVRKKVKVPPFKRKQQQRAAVKFAAESETITWGLQGDVSTANIIQGCLTSVTPQLFPAERSLFEHLQPAFFVSYRVWSPIRAFQDCLLRPL